MKLRNIIALGAFATATALAACGGGGGGGASSVPPPVALTSGAPSSAATTPPAVNGGAPPAGSLRATMTIKIPAASKTSARHRAPALVPSNTQSIVFTLLKTTGAGTVGGTQGPFPLTATSPGCSQDQQGNVTCTIGINAPIGQNIFNADIFSSTNAATGTKLGSGAVSLTIADNAQNVGTISLNGPIASILLADDCPASNLSFDYQSYVNACFLGDAPDAIGYPTAAGRKPLVLLGQAVTLPSIRLFVIALDTDGNVVVNPTVYDQPVTLALYDSLGLLSLNVSYSSASQTNAGAGPTAVATGPVGTVAVWSPQDAITLSTISGVTGYDSAFIASGIGPSVPAGPSAAPSSNPSASPGPTSTPGPSLHVVASQPGPIALSLSTPYFYNATPPPYPFYNNGWGTQTTSNSIQFLNVCSGDNPAPCAGSELVTINQAGYNGSYTLDTTTDSRCAGGSISIADPYGDSYYGGYQFVVSPVTAGFCSIVISDRLGHTYQLNTSVTTTSVTGR